MGSDSRAPKARHRFGFSGPATRQRQDRVTTDDILDSLTRQAELRQKLGEGDSLRLDGIEEREELSPLQGFGSEPVPPYTITKKRSFGHLTFIFMLLTGLTIVWSYSSISKPFDLASLNGIIQKSGIRSVFANGAQVGIIALIALIGVFWIHRRRRATSLPFLSTRATRSSYGFQAREYVAKF